MKSKIKKRLRRWVAVFLCLCVIFPSMQTIVIAEGNNGNVQPFGDPGVEPLADITPENSFIVVQKSISGLNEEQLNKLKESLVITVIGNEGTYELSYGEQDGTTILWREESPTLWSWRINGVTGGIYTVSETGCDPVNDLGMPDGSGLNVTGVGNVNIASVDIGLGVEMETTCSHNDWPLYDGAFFAGTLTKNRGTIVITARAPSASQRQAIESALLGGVWKEPVYYYSFNSLEIDTTNQDSEYSVPINIIGEDGSLITTLNYYPNKTYATETIPGEIFFSDRSVWQHVAKVSYNTEAIKAGDIQIVNAYTQPTTLENAFKVSKTLSGREWKDTDAFTFTITAEGNAPMPQQTSVTIKGTDVDKTADFGAIQYSTAGIYTYIIRESTTSVPGVTIDSTTYTVTVTVEDTNDDGILEISTQYSASKDGKPVAFNYDDIHALPFANTYNVTSANAALGGHKHLSGATLTRNQFSFYIDSVIVDKGEASEETFTDFTSAAQAGIPLPSVGLGKENAIKNGREGTSSEYMVFFGNLLFENVHVGHTYTYVIKEVKEDVTGYTYDTDAKEVTYKVQVETDADNTQHVDVQVIADASSPDAQQHGYFVFDNSYSPLPVNIDPMATKTLVGRDMLNGETFGFTLVANSQNPEGASIAAGGDTASVSGAIQGEPTEIKFGKITFSKAGTYQFFFRETSWNGSPVPTEKTEGMTFDTAWHNVTYTVEDVNGQLTVTNTVYGSNGMDIQNIYRIDISVEKIWQDNNDQDGIRPNAITVKLLADGAYTGKSEVLSEGNGWTSSFTDLDEYRNGKKINYSVEEESVAGYQTVISGDAVSDGDQRGCGKRIHDHQRAYAGDDRDPRQQDMG